MAFDNILFLIHMYLKKSFNFKEVNKIMSFRHKINLITFRHQCTLNPLNNDDVCSKLSFTLK